MKCLISLVLILSFSQTIKAQVAEITNRPFKRGILEASVTGFPLGNFVDVVTGLKKPFYENSIHIALMTNVSKYWMVGFNYNYLWTRYKQTTIDNYFYTGLNFRYDRPFGNRFRIYGDILADVSDYCPCTKDVRFENMPFKIDNSFYYGFGLGVAVKIYKPIWVNLAFNRYFLINKKYDSYDYVQPVLGIQIHAF